MVCKTDLITIERKCPFCGKMAGITVNEEKYKSWLGGEYIQSAFPNLTADEREMIKTGICPECFP